MLHNKFRRNQSSGSREEDYHIGNTTCILKPYMYTCLPYMHIKKYSQLGHVTNAILINLHFIVLNSLHTKLG